MFTSNRCYEPEGEMEQKEVGRDHSSFYTSVQSNLLSRALITSTTSGLVCAKTFFFFF